MLVQQKKKNLDVILSNINLYLYSRPYLEAIFNALECNENDYETLFALCLLYAMGHNEGMWIPFKIFLILLWTEKII